MREVLDTVVLLGALQGFALALVLALRKEDALANRLLATLVFAVALLIANDYAEARFAFSGYPHVLALSAPLPFTFGPLLYLYVVALTRPLSKPDPRWLFHLLPAAIDLVFMTVNFYLRTGDEKLAVVRELQAGNAPGTLRALQVMQAVQAVSYLAASWVALQRYARTMQGYYSDLSRVDLRWLRAMVIAHAGTWSLVITATVLRVAGLEGAFVQGLSRGVELGSTLVIFLTGYMSLWQPALYEKARAAARVEHSQPSEPSEPSGPSAPSEPTGPTEPTEPSAAHAPELRAGEPAPEPPPSLKLATSETPARAKYLRNRIDEAEATALVDKLLCVMQDDKLYRDGSLTLPVLAEAIGATQHELSQLLNVRLGKTFYGFVNGYRVAEVKAALADPAQAARGVLEIALEAGFNSKSTLNSFFKRETGQTPTEYREQAKSVRRVQAA